MRKLVIRPYKLGSVGARKLAKALTQKCGYFVKRVKQSYIPRRNEVVINWGTTVDYWKDDVDANDQAKTATNKIETFQKFTEHGVSSPEFTTIKAVATTWVEEGHSVLCRRLVSGHSGRGIVIADSVDKLVNAPLYVKYKKKKKEFRAHVIFDKVVEVVEKRKKAGFENRNNQIRNHSNGWVFCRDNVVVPEDLNGVARAAITSLGLKFGAVDIIWNEKENKCYALEVNSAPGIEGSTVNTYANSFYGKYHGNN